MDFGHHQWFGTTLDLSEGSGAAPTVTLGHDGWFEEVRHMLFRLWLVATVLWTCLIFFVASYDTRPGANVIGAKVALVPSAIVFVVGVMLIWAFGGFSHQK